MVEAPLPDAARRLRAARHVVCIAWVLTLGFDGFAFLALMMALGYAQGAGVLLALSVAGGIVTPLIAVGGVAVLLFRDPGGDFDVMSARAASLALVLLQMPACLWLGTNVRW